MLASRSRRPDRSAAGIEAALTADPEIDGILTLGPTGAAPRMAALTEPARPGRSSSPPLTSRRTCWRRSSAGNMLFAIDQQQYLQGYLPVVLLTLYTTNLNTVANPVIMTGPGFVTHDNAERVIELSEAGTR